MIRIFDENGIFLTVNKFLSTKDILSLGSTRCSYFILSNSNVIWKPIYEKLVKDKQINFSNSFLYKLSSSTSTIKYKYRYYLSLWDSRRDFLTLDDLVEHAFSFRFKAAAGDQWMNRDPWWQGKNAMTVKFNIDGSLSLSNKLSQISNSDVDNNNNNEEATEDDDVEYTLSSRLRWELVWKRGNKDEKKKKLQDYLNISNLLDNYNNNDNNILSLCQLKSISLPVPSSSITILSQNTGNILRIYVNDVVVPSYHVWRTESFAFIVESCWALYSNVKLPNKGIDVSLEDESLRYDTLSQSAEVYRYNRQIALTW